MSLNAASKNNLISRYFDLINAVRRCHTSDKKKLAKALGLSWPTLNNMISKTFEYKTSPIYIDEKGVYCIKPDFGYFVGISVGGVETQVSIVDFSLVPIDFCKHVVAQKIQQALSSFKFYKNITDNNNLACFETPQYPQDISLLCNKIIGVILDSFDTTDYDLLGVGVTFPGVFGSNMNDGIYKVGFCPNLSRLVGLSLIDLFDSRLLEKLNKNGISFVLSHDTDAVTVFEKEKLYNKDNISYRYCNSSNYACIYLGIGLGMGLIINRMLLRGACHSVGEIGHLIAPPLNFDNEELSSKEKKKIDSIMKSKTPLSCYCGVKNCLEHELRTKVFQCTSQSDFLEKTNNEDLRNFDRNNPLQYKIFKQYISYLMNLLINILNVDAIILAGRILGEMTPLKYDIELIKMSSGLAPSTNACKVIFGTNRSDVVALGGAVMSFFNLKNENFSNYNSDKTIDVSWQIISIDE